MGIIWEEPPAAALEATHRSGTIGEFMAALKERPLAWARLDRKYSSIESARAAAGVIRNGTPKGFSKGECEAIAFEDEGVAKVWARYVKNVAKGPAKSPGDDEDSADESESPAEVEARRAFPGKVRAWAKTRGIAVKAGRLPDALVHQYVRETGDHPPASRLTAVE